MSSADVPPFPASGHFIEAVRESARAAREAVGIKVRVDPAARRCVLILAAQIDDLACERLLLSPAFTSSFQRLAQEHGYLFPVKFDNAKEELNFLCVLSILNFASGYRAPLHALTGRGAFDNIRALLLGLFLSSSVEGENLLSAQGLKGMSEAKVAELMNLNIYSEKAHDTIPGVVVGERTGPAFEVVHLITTAMQSTGEVLVNGGYPDLGTFVIEALRTGSQSGGVEAQLNAVVERVCTPRSALASGRLISHQLVRAFPAFRDMSYVQGEPTYCFKKALLVLHGVYLRFGHLETPPFPVPDTSTLPIFSDNVIPSLCCHLGILDLSSAAIGLSAVFPGAGAPSSVKALLEEHATAQGVKEAEAAGSRVAKPPVQDGPVLSQEQAFALRASAIDVCEELVHISRNLDDAKVPQQLSWLRTITPPEVDAWLWAVAKARPDYRALDRFVLRDTTFF
jgi:hypothetical protein